MMEEGLLSNVLEWYGTSGGSVPAIFGALGVPVGWIRTCVELFDTFSTLDIQEELISRFLTEWGVDSGNNYTKYIGKCMDTWEPGSSEWTFSDCSNYRPGIFLGIPAVNLTTGEYVLFSSRTHPHMKLLDAVRASSTIPMFFTPWKDEKGHIYCDGALKEHYPWACIPKEKHDTTLLIACNEEQLLSSKHAPIYTLSEYISRILFFLSHTHREQYDIPKHRVVVNDTRVDVLDFFQTKEDLLSLVQSGIDAASAWITQHSSEEIDGRTPYSSDPGTLSSLHSSGPNTVSGTPLWETPPPRPVLVPDLPTSYRPMSRRWSL